jgi:hypothetical protein
LSGLVLVPDAVRLPSSFLPHWHQDFRKLVSGIDSKPFGYLAWQPHGRSPSAANRGNFKRALEMRSAEFLNEHKHKLGRQPSLMAISPRLRTN